jgi:hypothetical protein
MAKNHGKTKYRSLRSLEPWEVDGLHFHKQFPDIKIEKPARQPRSAALKSGAREIKTAAEDTVDAVKVAGLLTAVRAVQRYDDVKPKAEQRKQAINDKAYSLAERTVWRAYDIKDAATSKLDTLRNRRARVADFITGRSLMARVASVEPVKVREPKIPTVPLSKVIGNKPKTPKSPVRHEARRTRRPVLRTAAAVAALSLTAANFNFAEANNQDPVTQEELSPHAPYLREVKIANRPASVMDSSLTSTWSAPRAEERVVYNALPVPSINAVDYATRITQARDAAEQNRYNTFEISRADTLRDVLRQPYVSIPAEVSTYNAASRAEMNEIQRIAEAAQEQAEMQRVAAEREAAVAQIQPGQLMATLSFTQTGEAEGAPAGTYTNFHGVRAGVPQTTPGSASTAFEFDMGLPDILDNGFGMYLSTQVPDLDTGKETTNAEMPIVILGHNQSTINDPLNPDSTEAFRYPDKTVFRNPETGERGDMLTLTLADGSIRQYEAVSRAIVDINDPDVSKVIFESPFGGNGLNAYWCRHPRESAGETSLRGVDYYEDVTTQVISDPSLLSIRSQQ